MIITALRGDITAQDVDAIVNAANSALAGGGGVDGAIHRAAGARELHAACAAIGRCEPGDAVVTPGFALRARYIIHTVGPVWRGGGNGEPETLTRCYRSCIARADEIGARTIACPAISTGIYGYPIEAAARVAVATLREAAADVAEARLIAFDHETLRVYEDLLGAG